MRKLLFLLPLLAGLIVPVQASVDFYSYLRNVQIQRKWLNDSVVYATETGPGTARNFRDIRDTQGIVSRYSRGCLDQRECE